MTLLVGIVFFFQSWTKTWTREFCFCCLRKSSIVYQFLFRRFSGKTVRLDIYSSKILYGLILVDIASDIYPISRCRCSIKDFISCFVKSKSSIFYFLNLRHSVSNTVVRLWNYILCPLILLRNHFFWSWSQIPGYLYVHTYLIPKGFLSKSCKLVGQN